MISILCDHINTKPKLVAVAKKWRGGKRQVFANRLCCVECGELIKPGITLDSQDKNNGHF